MQVRIKLSKNESKKVRSNLTEKDINRIAQKKGISPRMVKYIRDGIYSDRHGVLKLFTKAIEKNVYEKTIIQNSINKL